MSIFKRYLQTISIFLFTISFATYTKAQLSLPFVTKGDLLVVKLSINKVEGQFIFDTGASNSVIDSVLAVKLGLKADGSNRSASTAGVSSFKYISNQKISLNEKDEIICKKLIFTNLKSLQELVGVEFAGIIGFDILNKYVTKIDYETKTISLFTQLDKSETAMYTAVPFNFNNGIPIPQFDVSFVLNNGEKFTGTILFDTGAGLILSVNTPFKETHQLSKKIGKTLISQSKDLFKDTKQESAVIKSITIGTYTFENLPIQLTSAKAGVSAYPYYLGLLGNKIINRFNIIVDYANKVIYFKPNQNFEHPFEFPLSGIRFKKVKNQILIAYITMGSEAEKLGLKPGQRITAVDGYTGNDMEELRKLLLQEGKTIKISAIGADGKTKDVDLLLKKLL